MFDGRGTVELTVLWLIMLGFAAFGLWLLGRVLRATSAPTKKCPHCAEMIKAEARVCRYRGRDV